MKRVLLLGLGSALICFGAAAQSAQETVNVSANVQINPPAQAVISGIQDITMDISSSDNFNAESVSTQTFCLFTPTQFFTLTLTGSNAATGTLFTLVDSAQTNTSLNSLPYGIEIQDGFSGLATNLSGSVNGFSWGVPVTGIDSNLFNTDETCTDGDNLVLAMAVVDDGTTGSTLAGVADGETHTYTDTLTILLDPEL